MRYAPLYDNQRRSGTYIKGGSYYRVEVPPYTPLSYVVKDLAMQGGGIIQLGPHTYDTVGTINLTTGVSICGVPGATKIRKTTGDGPVVRVFTGARLEDCAVELSRTDGTTYTVDQNPTNAWENSVVHLCEPSLPGTKLMKTSSDNNGWEGPFNGAATLSGCSINTLVSRTRGVYVSRFGVFGEEVRSGVTAPVTLTTNFLNVRIINNTIIPMDASTMDEQSCIYFATGKYYGVCTGNICTAGDSDGDLGIIRYDSSVPTAIAFGGVATGTSFNLVSSNCAQYSVNL